MIILKTFSMKCIHYKFLLVLLVCWACVACRKADKLMYDDAPEVYFFEGYYVTNPDSLDYTFVIRPDSVVADTLHLQLRISGFAANRDRGVNLVVADSSTAIRGKHFRFDSVIVKAGEYKVDVPIYVLRTPDMKSRQFRIWFRVGESADFKPGYKNRLSYLIKVTDELFKPSDWEDFLYGNYSLVKHKFMVSRLGHLRITISLGAQFSEMLSILQKMRVELANYERTHGPLIDENGDRVEFPLI